MAYRLRPLRMAVIVCCALFMAFSGHSAFADPVVGANTTPTETATTPSLPEVTPDGDAIAVASSAAWTTATAPNANPAAAFVKSLKAKQARLRKEIGKYRAATKHWAQIMGISVRQIRSRHLAAMGLPALEREARAWKKLAKRTRLRAQHPPHLADFLCIHRYEGSWTDKGAPYYGGLQMDLGFQQSYGRRLYDRKGMANHWSPLEQIWVAEKAHKSRGFWPWPNTARYCHLL